jgi:alkaline phosphatase D
MSDFHRRRFRLLPRPLISRRQFLQRTGGASLGALSLMGLPGCGSSAGVANGLDGRPEEGAPTPVTPAPDAVTAVQFLHGVASGDPRADRVVLWTRATPPGPETPDFAVDWTLSLSPDLAEQVAGGRFITGAARDFTVKVDPGSLRSATTYYYQFAVTLLDGRVVRSPIGRTRTAPGAADVVDRVRAAVVSCSNYSFGFFNAYGRIAERADLDLVIHLGDYLYESGGSAVRAHEPPGEILSLSDYRVRHAQYKTDPDLQAAHRQHPWITTWDDHESTNNSYRTGAANHTEGAEGCWEERLGWAIRAYFEWMPIRDNGPGFDAPIQGEGQTCEITGERGLLPEGLGRIYRSIPYGPLIDFILLDTRHAGRTVQNGTAINSPEQTILGAEQREWFLAELARSTAQWKVIGTGTTFAPLLLPTGANLNSDAWDGYPFDRDAVFDAIEANGVQNSVFIFGDIHAVIACDLPRQPNDPLSYNPLTGEGSLGVELGCSGVANVPLPIWNALRASGQNPHMKHVNEVQLGYLLMDIDRQRTQAEWYYSVVQQRSGVELPDPVMLQTVDASQRLTPALIRSSAQPNPPPLAP